MAGGTVLVHQVGFEDISKVTLTLILMFSEMVERGGYTSLDLLDGDCVLRPQVLLRYLRPSFLYGWCVLMLPRV